MTTGIFFSGSAFKTKFGNDFGNVELDANLDESHDWAAEATQNPLEFGSPISDHVIEQADKLTLQCFVSDNPIGAGLSKTTGIRLQEVFDLLYFLIKKKETVTVYTRYKIYLDMVLTSISIPRNASIGEALEFTCNFLNIRKVETQTVDVPPGISAKKTAKAGGQNGSIAKKTEPTKNTGKKQAQINQNEKLTSTLSRLTDRGVDSLL
jgi:hypothetical protein